MNIMQILIDDPILLKFYHPRTSYLEQSACWAV